MNNHNIVKISNLSVSYKQNLVIDNINLNFDQGERIAIIGKNGVGKTTFIEAIIGLNKTSKESKVWIDDKYKKAIGCVFQDMNYDAELSLKEIYQYYMLIVNKEIDYSIFDLFELSDCLKRKFKSLSGGQKQKFKLLMVLSLEPKLLILDELSSSLDYEWRSEIIKLLKNYLEKNKDVLLILVSHDFKEIEKLCNKFYLLENKKIKQIKNLGEYFCEE